MIPKKAILLNDTRSAGHVGCKYVVEGILGECQRVGVEVVRTVTTAECKQDTTRLLETSPARLLLINGEGTMHDDRPVPTQICLSAARAKKWGWRVVLLNSLWDRNQKLNEFLPVFDRIFCRESDSANLIRSLGFPAEVVPDMIFGTDVRQRNSPEPSLPLVVIDSIEREVSAGLGDLARRAKAAFLHMDRVGHERLRRPWFWNRAGRYSPEPEFAEEFLQTLASAERVISGRFHGTCLAFLLGRQVVSVSSNTRKIESLYKDIGLDPSLVLKSTPANWNEPSLWAARQAELAHAYVSRAKVQIVGMFDEIARLV